jgi:hypothetical protein
MRNYLAIFFIIVLFGQHFTGFAKNYKSSPYFVVTVYHIDGRNTANGLDIIDGFPDAVGMGAGYEFVISDPWRILTEADFATSTFHASFTEDFDKKALLSISTNAFALDLSSRYYPVLDDETGFFVGLLSRIESTSSLARFKFKDKNDSKTSKVNSAFQFQYGLEIGLRFSLNENLDNGLSLGFVSSDYGGSINKLNLEQSGYFKNETMKRSTSVELKATFYIHKNK